MCCYLDHETLVLISRMTGQDKQRAALSKCLEYKLDTQAGGEEGGLSIWSKT